MRRATAWIAVSRRMPVGLPAPSRSMTRPGGAAQAHDLRATAGRGACSLTDGQDPPVGTGRDLRLAAGEENRARALHKPYVLAMISFMISSVPAPIRARRASRQALSTGNS